MGEVAEAVDAVYRRDSRRVLATLIRLLGDFDLAEEALHEAFAAAVTQWAADGLPDNPRAWLVSTGRFKAIDRLRRRQRFDEAVPELQQLQGAGDDLAAEAEREGLDDDRLRLIFVCCHPALAPEARLALTLREVCDLSNEEIARAFLSRPATIAQRIVRAKAKIRDAGIAYRVPPPAELPERLDSVLRVLYLVFNEGYAASGGDALVRRELCAEAIRVATLLVELLPHPEALGLLALMLFHDARRETRTDDRGRLVLLEDQDRRRWDRGQIEQAEALLARALAPGRVGAYALQAAIAGAHARAETAAATDWKRIVALYELLCELAPSPVVQLNAAVALAMRDGPAAGLERVEQLLEGRELQRYHPAHAARAELLRRLGRKDEAADAFRRAIALAAPGPEREHMEARLRELVG